MDQLVIRFGSSEGPRSPTSDDVRKALEDIESGACVRPEFTIEKVSNWKPVVENGQQGIRCVMEGRYATAATFYDEGDPTPLGWYVTYHAEDDSRFALALPGADKDQFVEGLCYGGPMTVRSRCLVPLNVAHAALAYFAEHKDKAPDQLWLAESECYRIG